MSVNSDEILKDVLLAAIKEQRAKRRWGIFFKLLFFIIVFGIFAAIFSQNAKSIKSAGSSYTALIDVKGVISDDTLSNADNVVEGLENAFKDPNVKGIILRINSPGGSPVQASEIYNEVMRQRTLHPKIKVYAVCTDVCASAAYYIASSANAIYANPSSLVGSIGVLIDGFGFVDTLNKLGVGRRLITSGDHKGFLDPFSPLKPEDLKIAQEMIDSVHAQFIQDVMKGRGARLKVNDDTFSGLAWTGMQAFPQGLIDGYGSAAEVARNVVKTENIEDFTVKPNPIDLFAQRLGASFAQHLSALFQTKLD
jgi:protease-4